MPKLLVFTVEDVPRHAGPDRAVAALLGAFAFAPVVYREQRGGVVTFHAEIPEVQLEQLPAAVDALCALADVESVAVVTLGARDEAPPGATTGDATEAAGCDGGSARSQS